MDLTTFEELLDRHGADPERWMQADRADAAALLGFSNAARALLATMTEIEGVLKSRVVVDEAAGSVGAMAARAMQRRQETVMRRLALRLGWAAAAAAVLVFGLAIGNLAAQHSEDPEHVMAVAFDAGSAADVD